MNVENRLSVEVLMVREEAKGGSGSGEEKGEGRKGGGCWAGVVGVEGTGRGVGEKLERFHRARGGGG